MPKKVLFMIHSLKLTYPRFPLAIIFVDFPLPNCGRCDRFPRIALVAAVWRGHRPFFSVLAWWKNSMVVEWFFLVISNALQVADCTGSAPTCTETKQDRSTILSLHHPVRLEDTLHSLKARRKSKHSKWAKHKETAQIYCK